jgi:hypothetical protein
MSARRIVAVPSVAWGGTPSDASDLGEVTVAAPDVTCTSLGGAAVLRVDFNAEYPLRRTASPDLGASNLADHNRLVEGGYHATACQYFASIRISL